MYLCCPAYSESYTSLIEKFETHAFFWNPSPVIPTFSTQSIEDTGPRSVGQLLSRWTGDISKVTGSRWMEDHLPRHSMGEASIEQ